MAAGLDCALRIALSVAATPIAAKNPVVRARGDARWQAAKPTSADRRPWGLDRRARRRCRASRSDRAPHRMPVTAPLLLAAVSPRHEPPRDKRRVGGEVTQRIANPCRPVRFRYPPPGSCFHASLDGPRGGAAALVRGALRVACPTCRRDGRHRRPRARRGWGYRRIADPGHRRRCAPVGFLGVASSVRRACKPGRRSPAHPRPGAGERDGLSRPCRARRRAPRTGSGSGRPGRQAPPPGPRSRPSAAQAPDRAAPAPPDHGS